MVAYSHFSIWCLLRKLAFSVCLKGVGVMIKNYWLPLSKEQEKGDYHLVHITKNSSQNCPENLKSAKIKAFSRVL